MFSFSHYQTLTRFAQLRCDSEQELGDSHLDEKWLVDQVLTFARSRYSRYGQYTYEFNTFVPAEFRTGKAGGPRKIDVAGFGRWRAAEPPASLLLEAKLMKETKSGRNWAGEIVADLFRVACARDRTNSKTRRLVLVVGREQCWKEAMNQCDGILGRLCPINHRLRLLTAGLTNVRRSVTLGERWRGQNDRWVEEYLRPMLPTKVGVELVGLARTSRGPGEEPDWGMTARMWRVYPGKRPAV